MYQYLTNKYSKKDKKTFSFSLSTLPAHHEFICKCLSDVNNIDLEWDSPKL